jgi:hypothetical protein
VTTTCPQCGGLLAPGQPVCADCGKPTADAPGTAAPPPPLRPGAIPPVKRDKQKDYSLIGSTIADKYKVLDVLGQGGFGTVYLVEITAGMVGERLALKLLPEELSSLPAFRGQFLNEIRLAMRVVDRYIVQIRDVGSTEDGRLYYTMDLSPGLTLAQVIRNEGRLAVTRACLVVLNVLRALQTAHAAGIIHLDLKPANIMVESQGGKETVRVLDFGIATAVIAQGEKRKGFAGSPHYMPPEQFLGEEVGFATDLYSVGVILYECVTGQKPYPGSSPREVFNNLKSRPPVLPEALAPEVASYPGLSELILKAMERNPERRFQSAKALFDALNEILLRGTVVEAAAPAPAEPRDGPRAGPRPALAQRPPRRRPLARAARRRSDSRGGMVALIVLTLAAVGLFAVFRDDIERLLGSTPAGPGDLSAAAPSSTETARKTLPPSPPAAAREKAAPPAVPSVEPGLGETRKKAEAELAGRVESFLDDARKSLADRHWAGAMERADVVLRMDPENVEAHRVRGIAAFESGDFTAAADSLDRARAGAPGGKPDRALLVRLSRAMLGAAPPRLREAEDAAKAAVREDPKDPEAVLLLIEVLEKQGRLQDRKRVVGAAKKGKVASQRIDALWEEIFVVEPKKRREDGAKMAAAAREAFEKGDWEAAAGLADAWSTVSPEDGADILAADALLELGDLERARRPLERALDRARSEEDGLDEDDGLDEEPAPAVEPDADRARLDGRLHFIEGRLRLAGWEKTGKPEDLAHAEDSFRKAIASLGKLEGKAERKLSSLASLGLARMAAAAGNGEAVAEATKRLDAADEPAVILEEGRILVLLAERSTASEDALRALNAAKRKLLPVPKMRGVTDPDRAAAHFLLGVAHLRLGDLERNERSYRLAVDSFAAAQQAGLDTAELDERWALAYDRAGNLVRAAQLYREAYEKEKTPASCLRAAESQLKANPRSPEAIAILEEGSRLFPEYQEIQRRYRELRE